MWFFIVLLMIVFLLIIRKRHVAAYDKNVNELRAGSLVVCCEGPSSGLTGKVIRIVDTDRVEVRYLVGNDGHSEAVDSSILVKL